MSAPTTAEVEAATGCQPGTAALQAAILAAVPGSTTMGCYARRPVRGGSTWSYHAAGRAIDIGGSADGMAEVAERAVALADQLSIEEVIYNRQIWTSARRGEGWRPYTGVNPHVDHVHISQGEAGAAASAERITQIWGSGTGNVGGGGGGGGGGVGGEGGLGWSVPGVGGITDALGAVNDVFSRLTSAEWWKRVGMGAGGLVLMGVGVTIVLAENKTVRGAVGTAVGAAAGGPAGAKVGGALAAGAT